MSEKCYQVVFTGPGSMELQSRTLPHLKPEEICIRTQTSLISPGTERAFFLGLPNTTQTYPQFTGYNNVGEVLAVGEAVADFAPGIRVASPSHHASIVHAPASETYRVPDKLDNKTASFFNLVSIALQGVRKAHIEVGEPVTVIGAGLIGLLAGQLAHINGALPVTVMDRDASRLAFASAVGLKPVVASVAGGDISEAPVVIEATGHPDAINSALALAAPGGRVVLLGSTRGVTGEVNFYRDVHRKGLLVIGAHDIARPHYESRPGYWTQSDDRRVALRLLAAGRLRVEPLITHQIAWNEVDSAYEPLRNWDAGALGIILNWQV